MIEQGEDAINRVLEILQNRVDQFGVSEPTIQKQGNQRIIIELAGVQDSERARAWFTEPNRDFALVCQYAGFDHEYVRMKAIKFFKEKEDEEKNMPEVHWEWVHKSERDSGSTT